MRMCVRTDDCENMKQQTIKIKNMYNSITTEINEMFEIKSSFERLNYYNMTINNETILYKQQ